MRIYIIGTDGITLCREPPTAASEGEIVITSNAELHAARLSGKRLLALWNALPDVEKLRKVGDRDRLIDQLWSAIEALPDPQSDDKRPSKQDEVIAMLRRPEGVTVDEVASATGWQRHTVRGIFSGTLKRKSSGWPSLRPRNSAAGSTASRQRQTRDPRNSPAVSSPEIRRAIIPDRSRCPSTECGQYGDALSPPRARHRRTASGVAWSLQNTGTP